MKNKILIIALIIFLLALSIVIADNLFPVYVRNRPPNTNIELELNYTTDILCSNVLLSDVQNIPIDNKGVGFMLSNITTLSTTPSFICEYQDDVLTAIHQWNTRNFVGKEIVFNDIIIDNNDAGILNVNGSVALKDDGKYYLSTNKNKYLIYNQSKSEFRLINNDDGDIWIGSEKGLGYFSDLFGAGTNLGFQIGVGGIESFYSMFANVPDNSGIIELQADDFVEIRLDGVGGDGDVSFRIDNISNDVVLKSWFGDGNLILTGVDPLTDNMIVIVNDQLNITGEVNILNNVTAVKFFGELNNSLWEVDGGVVQLKTAANVDLKDKDLTVAIVKSGSSEVDVSNAKLSIGGIVIIDWLAGLLKTLGGDTILDFGTDGLADFDDSDITTTGNIEGNTFLSNLIPTSTAMRVILSDNFDGKTGFSYTSFGSSISTSLTLDDDDVQTWEQLLGSTIHSDLTVEGDTTATKYIFGAETDGDTFFTGTSTPDVVSLEIDGVLIQDWNQVGGTETTNLYTVTNIWDNGGNNKVIEFKQNGDINAIGDLDVVGNITGSRYYLHMFNHSDSGVTHDITVQDSYINLTIGSQNNFANGFSFNAGKYSSLVDTLLSCNYGISFNGNTNQEYHGQIGIDGIAQNCHGVRDAGAASATGNMAMPCIINVVVGDIITLMVENDMGIADVTTDDYSLVCVGIN